VGERKISYPPAEIAGEAEEREKSPVYIPDQGGGKLRLGGVISAMRHRPLREESRMISLRRERRSAQGRRRNEKGEKRSCGSKRLGVAPRGRRGEASQRILAQIARGGKRWILR